MEDDEDDYMSDKFVGDSNKSDIRPGLIHNRTHKRCHEISKREAIRDEENRKRKCSTKVMEAENLKEGLQKPICSNNKGFALLQKMGFNAGSGLGKSGEGRVEPIPIELKNDRFGLGRQTVLREIAVKKMEMAIKRSKEAKMLTAENFRQRKREEAMERAVTTDLILSQKACYTLDLKMNIEEPSEAWFWPEKYKEKKKNEDDEEEEEEGEQEEADESEEENSDEVELTGIEKLDILTMYLRGTYFYCIWCGVQYEDEKDLQSACPGQTRDDH